MQNLGGSVGLVGGGCVDCLCGLGGCVCGLVLCYEVRFVSSCICCG